MHLVKENNPGKIKCASLINDNHKANSSQNQLKTEFSG